MERPTLRQLEYFVAVAERLSFRKAAESCFVSQPALSAQIAQLEAMLGVKLFERDRRGVQLTPAGRACFSGSSGHRPRSLTGAERQGPKCLKHAGKSLYRGLRLNRARL